MNTLYNEAKERGRYQHFETKTRIKIGRGISAWALLPFNFSLWMLPIGLALSMPLSPTVYAKSKMIDFKEWRSLK